MLRVRRVLALGACLLLVACVLSPLSRTATESTDPVNLAGFVESPNQTVTIEAVDQNSGQPIAVSSATSASSGFPYTAPSGAKYTMYPWSRNLGVLAANYWAPQSIVPNVANSQGHLEIFASVGGILGRSVNLQTFSVAALASALISHKDPATAASLYSDGTSTVLFDQDGVNSGPEGPWVNVQGMVSTPPASGYAKVAWSVGYYTVEGGTKIYGLICSPLTGGPYPVVIYNHGGYDSTNGGNINGQVNSAGWTSPPTPGPDNLGQCLDWAKRGWIFAASSYRGQNVTIASADPVDFPAPPAPWTSDGNVEFCMGEVTDVMALTDLVVNHASSIKVGSASQNVALNVNSQQVFMYGYSHGGCMTYRAVEQGAPVTSFTVIEGFTDLILNYLNWTGNGQPASVAAQNAGAVTPSGGRYYPDTNGVMGYNWRSAHYFAARGDLSIQKFKTMPILILHGDVDTDNPVFLDEPVELASDINATNIFVGPSGVSPLSSQPCMGSPVGAPIADSTTVAPATCPVSYNPMDTNDSCVTGSTVPVELNECGALTLQPAPGKPPHYFVVYHNMNHTNGGLAFKKTFNAFVKNKFGVDAGCDGVELVDVCTTD
jgi:hypothetical protein